MNSKPREVSISELRKHRHFVLTAFFVQNSHFPNSLQLAEEVMTTKNKSKRFGYVFAKLDEALSRDDYTLAEHPHRIKELSGGYRHIIEKSQPSVDCQWMFFNITQDNQIYLNATHVPYRMIECGAVHRIRKGTWLTQFTVALRLDDQPAKYLDAVDAFVDAAALSWSKDSSFLLGTLEVDTLEHTHGGMRHSLVQAPGCAGIIATDVLYEHRRRHKALLGEKLVIPTWGYILGRAAAARLDLYAIRDECKDECESSPFPSVWFKAEDIVKSFGKCAILRSSPTVAQGLNPNIEWAQSNAIIAGIFWSHLHKAGLTL